MGASLSASSDHQTRDMEHPEDEQALPEDDAGVPQGPNVRAGASTTSRGVRSRAAQQTTEVGGSHVLKCNARERVERRIRVGFDTAKRTPYTRG